MNKKQRSIYNKNYFKSLNREEKDERNRKTNEFRRKKENRPKINKTHNTYCKNNRDKINNMSRKLNFNRRMRLIVILGSKCINCGINDPLVLQFGHKNNNGGEDRKRFTINGKYRAEKMYVYYIHKPKEAKQKLKCQCANCNWKDRYIYGGYYSGV